LTHRAYSRGEGERNAEGSAGRDAARRQWLHQSCKQRGAALLIPCIFITALPLPYSHPDTSAITPILTPLFVPQLPLEEGSSAGPCRARSIAKKAWN